MTKFEIQIGVGELIDRITILKIKKLNSLNVDIELNALEKSLLSFDEKYTYFFEKILFEINLTLWDIEESKRTKLGRYTKEYDNYSTLTTILNDLRHETKRKIDKFYNSEFTEQKSYKI
jgi:hypothetical protein